MKPLLLFILLLASALNLFPQNDTILKFIFVPHPRSEDKVEETTLPAIEAINFSKYNMILLGGDLTYSVSKNHTAMNYCDSLFDLDSPNTLWTMGNHDVVNRNLIKEYTKRPSYFTYYRDNITFLLLDTELDADRFVSSYISGSQLEMVNNVCDTISQSEYLIVLHGRLLWMVGNTYFKEKIDSVAESTKQLDTTNFFQVIYPQLVKAKKNGVKVICLGGDKSKINIEYSPEDSITFMASTMAPEFADSVNDVLVFNYNVMSEVLSWEFIPLNKVEKNEPDTIVSINNNPEKKLIKIWNYSEENKIKVIVNSEKSEKVVLEVFTIQGTLYNIYKIETNTTNTIPISKNGFYIVKARLGNELFVKKIIVN